MNFREAKPDDLDFVMNNALYPHQVDKDCRKRICYDYTFEQNDTILGMGGFIILNDTTAECWVFLTTFAMKPIIPNLCTLSECMRRIKDQMEIFAKNHGILRFQAWVSCDFEEGNRLVRHLGFEKESKMINYLGKDKDAWLYVKMMEIE